MQTRLILIGALVLDLVGAAAVLGWAYLLS
jgi:hypothetical protein